MSGPLIAIYVRCDSNLQNQIRPNLADAVGSAETHESTSNTRPCGQRSPPSRARRAAAAAPAAIRPVRMTWVVVCAGQVAGGLTGPGAVGVSREWLAEGDQHSAANDRPSGDGSLVATSVKSKE